MLMLYIEISDFCRFTLFFHEHDFNSKLIFQTNIMATDLKAYSDEILKSSKTLRKHLFIALVDDPDKTYHLTGLQ